MSTIKYVAQARAVAPPPSKPMEWTDTHAPKDTMYEAVADLEDFRALSGGHRAPTNSFEQMMAAIAIMTEILADGQIQTRVVKRFNNEEVVEEGEPVDPVTKKTGAPR